MNQKQRDILCGMLKKRAVEIKRQISEQFCLVGTDKYDIGRTIERSPKCIYQLSKQQQIRYYDLTRVRKVIDKQQEAFRTEWNQLMNEIIEECVKYREAKQIAVSKLDTAMDNAVIEVQFAEDATQAKAVVNNLPTLEQLLG